jgi:low affinity Fe/Cu permease
MRPGGRSLPGAASASVIFARPGKNDRTLRPSAWMLLPPVWCLQNVPQKGDASKGHHVKPTRSTTKFTRFSKWAARMTGRPAAFAIAVALVAAWGITGFLFEFSDTWQLVINTATTIVTFLMVFLIQSTQNRDSEAIQVKLDELIRTTKGAQDELLDLEELEENELDRIRDGYQRIAERARASLRSGGKPPASVVDLASKNDRGRT